MINSSNNIEIIDSILAIYNDTVKNDLYYSSNNIDVLASIGADQDLLYNVFRHSTIDMSRCFILALNKCTLSKYIVSGYIFIDYNWEILGFLSHHSISFKTQGTLIEITILEYKRVIQLTKKYRVVTNNENYNISGNIGVPL